MLQRTAKAFAILKKAPWFSRVGLDDVEGVRILSSWEEAVESSRSKAWRDRCVNMADLYLERVLERSPERFATWMDVPREAEDSIRALIAEKTKRIVKKLRRPGDLLNTLFWDVGHLLIEVELSDVYPPGFYMELGAWYVEGRFPCGWEGTPPEGRLVIY